MPYWATLMALFGSWSLALTPWGLLGGWFLAPNIIAAVLGAGYGILMIATARQPLLKPVWFFPGLASTPSAARWYGLAYVLAQCAAWGSAIVVHLTFGDVRSESEILLLLLGPLTVLLAFTACILLARRAANRPLEQAIQAGMAPSYVLAGLQYWWDGEHWQSLASSVPESALRSPDGHYWWTGHDWFRMPPNRPNEDLRPRALPNLGA